MDAEIPMEQSIYEMSGIDSSSMSSMSTEAKDEDQYICGLIPLALGCMAVLAFIAIGAAAFQYSVSTPTESTAAEEEQGGLYIGTANKPKDDRPKKPDPPPTEATTTPSDMPENTDPPPTEATTTPSDRPENTDPPTTKTTTTQSDRPKSTDPPTTETTTTRRAPKPEKRPDRESLLCTFGLSTNENTKFPADGICDYFFFDSAYSNGKNTLATASGSFEPNLRRFLSEVSKFTKTEFGVAFSYNSRSSVTDHLKQRNPTRLEVFWKKNVYHFGIIDVPVFGVFDDAGLLSCLQTMAELAKMQSDYGTASYVVVGAAVHNRKLTKSFREMLSKYEPDLFISLGHYQYGDHERESCYSMPPTAIGRPFHAHGYPYDISTSPEVMEKLKNPDSDKVNWLTSVGMKGRWTLKLPFTATQTIMAPCTKNTSVKYFGAYTEVCNNPDFLDHLKYDDQNEAMWTFDQGRSMFIYDNELALCRKLCMVKANHTSLRYGIAVFDLDYEDSSNQCSKQNKFPGGFSRLQTLRKVLDYFKGFTSAQQKEGCFHLVPSQ